MNDKPFYLNCFKTGVFVVTSFEKSKETGPTNWNVQAVTTMKM